MAGARTGSIFLPHFLSVLLGGKKTDVFLILSSCSAADKTRIIEFFQKK